MKFLMSSCLVVLSLSSGHKLTKVQINLRSKCAKNEYCVWTFLFLNICDESFCSCCCSFLMSFYFSENQVHCQTEHGYLQDLVYSSFTFLCLLIVFFKKIQNSPHCHSLAVTHFPVSLNCICLKC